MTITIRYCSGSVPIHPLPAEFVPILQFSIRLWSDLYLSLGKKKYRICPDIMPILPNAIRQRSDSDPTVTIRIRQDLDPIWTQSASNGNEKSLQIMPVHHDSVPIHRTPSRYRSDNKGHCNDFDPIQQNLSRHNHDCNPIGQNRLSFPNITFPKSPVINKKFNINTHVRAMTMTEHDTTESRQSRL